MNIVKAIQAAGRAMRAESEAPAETESVAAGEPAATPS
jgi:hypothetical protein